MTAPVPHAAPVASLGEPALDKPYYGIGFGGAVSRFFRKYAVFSGRASRSEFWWALLFNGLVSGALGLVGNVVAPAAGLGVILPGIYSLAILVPTLAVGWRRLHDTGKSGLWYFLPFLLIVIGYAIFIPTLLAYGGALQNGNAQTIAAGSFGLVSLAVVLMLIGAVLGVILFVVGPKPKGERFDK